MNWWADYIGIPFEDGGRGPNSLDCWGLLRMIYSRELGVDLPSYGEVSAHDLVRIARTISRDVSDGWVAVDVPREFDGVIMRSGAGRSAIVHVGVMVDRCRLIHVEKSSATAVVSVSHYSVSHRIAGYRRHETLAYS